MTLRKLGIYANLGGYYQKKVKKSYIDVRVPLEPTVSHCIPPRTTEIQRSKHPSERARFFRITTPSTPQ